MIKQLPISLHGAAKGEARTQFGGLCFRVRKGKVQVLLVTSRRTKRWIVPKGWPMEGKTPGDSALEEAWEEAGVRGRVAGDCIGVYAYAKDDKDLTCLTMIYPIEVKSLAKKFPESKERRRIWVSRKKASRMVNEPELARLIRDFDSSIYIRKA